MPSITSSFFPVPKLRVTRRNWTPGRAQEAHSASDEIDRNDKERPRVTDLDDRLGSPAVGCRAADDEFRFARRAVFLPFDDGAGEDEAFDIEDREIVIFKFFRCVKGYDVVQGSDEFANPGYGGLPHTLA